MMGMQRTARGDGDGNFQERVVAVRRVAKTVAGGRRFSFSAVVVVGDGQGHVGVATGKAREAPEAIRKGVAAARRALITVPMVDRTIPHAILSKFGASRVLLKPARPGTGVIAGGSVRAVVEAAGLHDIVSKSMGSRTAINVVKAAFEGLRALKDPKAELARRRTQAVGE